MSKTKVGRLVRRHNRLVERRARLQSALDQMPEGQEPQVFKLLDRILHEAAKLSEFPAPMRAQIEALPPLSIDALRGDDSPIIPLLAKAIQLGSRPLRILIVAWASTVAGWLGFIAGLLFDLAVELGARFMAWVLLKVIVAGTKAARVQALDQRVQKLRETARALAQASGVEITEANGLLYVDDEAITDEGDDEVVALLA